MLAKIRFSLMMAMTVTIFVASAIWTVPAFADDSTPPPPVDTPEVTPPVVVDPIDAPIVASPTEAPADITPVDPTPPAEVPSPDAISTETVIPADQNAALGDILAQAPEGTDVVVLNAEGETLPLASKEAADVIASGDPMWCPVGVTPGGAGCTTPGQTSFAAMLAEVSLQNLGTGPGKAGVIWIEGWNSLLSTGYNSSVNDVGVTSFTLNGDTLTSMAKYALTIQGGWTGTGTAVNQFNPSEFHASLSILNWLAPITINDILVTGATVNPNPGTNGALQVETTKSITLNRVQSSDNINGLWGAVLDNGNGSPGTLAPITVNNSTFNHNTGSGLVAYSEGAITVRNLTANYNGTNGVTAEWGTLLTNWVGQNTKKPITLNGTNEFKGNLSDGLYVTSYGIVTLNNITAYANSDTTTNEGTGVNVAGSLAVKLTGTNLFNYNHVNGLDVTSRGNISLNNITASNNGQNGALLNNFCDHSLLPPQCLATQTISVTGSNYFNENLFDGLSVQSSGAITISQIVATHNDIEGARLDNCVLSTVCTTLFPFAVTISGPSTFLYNGFDGLYILTTGAVSLKGITSSFNHNRGVYIDNHANPLKPQNVTLSTTNIVNDNDNIGLRILSYGAVNISNLTANGNGITDACQFCFGAWIDNAIPNGATLESFVVSRQPVTFTGTNNFNNNYSAGLYVYSVGAITLSNITASGTVNNVGATVGDGVYLYNNWHWVPGGVTGGPRTSYAANVTINGFGIFENNADEGLQIITRGAVKLNNMKANNNNGYGLYVDNRYYRNTPLPAGSILAIRQPVTLTGTNIFNGNLGGGLYIYSVGAVAVSNVTALDNRSTGSGGLGNGVYIDNDLAWYPNGVTLTPYAANVTLSGFGFFEGNTEIGLQIMSRGLVSLNNTTANTNGDDGAVIFTKGDLLPQNVTLNGSNSFYGNGFTSTNGNGLFIQSDGKITINNLSAIGNRSNGAWLDNCNWNGSACSTSTAKAVTLTGFNYFQRNQGVNGLFIHSDGIVLLYHVTADDNSGNGVNVVATKNITISCGSAFSNFGTGFLLNSGVMLTLKGVHAYGNGTDEILTPTIPIPDRTYGCP